MNAFVICIDNRDNPASLIVGKVYRRLEDPVADGHGMVRVIDEDTSERDGYLYPADRFAPIEVPAIAERVLLAASA